MSDELIKMRSGVSEIELFGTASGLRFNPDESRVMTGFDRFDQQEKKSMSGNGFATPVGYQPFAVARVIRNRRAHIGDVFSDFFKSATGSGAALQDAGGATLQAVQRGETLLARIASLPAPWSTDLRAALEKADQFAYLVSESRRNLQTGQVTETNYKSGGWNDRINRIVEQYDIIVRNVESGNYKAAAEATGKRAASVSTEEILKMAAIIGGGGLAMYLIIKYVL